MTPALCRGLALAQQLRWYALQGGRECCGGVVDPTYLGVVDGGCQVPCTGAAPLKCGGPMQSSLYRIPQTGECAGPLAAAVGAAVTKPSCGSQQVVGRAVGPVRGHGAVCEAHSWEAAWPAFFSLVFV